jgi:xanthine phosphoribosyltransferase
VIFAKKSKSKNINGEIYTASAYSFTHDVTNTIVLPKALLSSADRVLILDDFLANGSAAEALVSLCKQAKAEIAGVGVFVEKAYQGGGEKLRKEGIRVDALAKIKSMDPQKGIEFC